MSKLVFATISGVFSLGTPSPSYPAGPVEYIRFYGDGATVIKVDGIPKEVFSTNKNFQMLLLTTLFAGAKVQVHGENCTRGRPFDEFSVFP